MAQGVVSYPGVSYPKGCIYTQTLGVNPDRLVLFCTPQGTAIPTRGDVTIQYGLATLVVAGCWLDDVTVVADVQDGHRLALTFLDRRELWTLSDTIRGEYNTYRAGTQVAWRKKSLRELVQILLEYVGETSPNVAALPNNIYPEVRWDDIHPVRALDELLSEWGFSLALGFGTEPIKIVQLGTGSVLGTTTAMMASSTVDPKTRPNKIRVRFNDSLMQARLKLEAVGLDDDDTWKPISDLTYKPTTWDKEDPVTFPNVKAAEPAETYARCATTVYRAYRIKAFADDTLNLPDGSGSIADISQLLPLKNRLLDSEAIRTEADEPSYIPFRIYGKRQIPYTEGEPVKFVNTTVDAEVVGERVRFDGENGIILFEKPQFFVEEGNYKPAELYLECTFQITELANFYPMRYKKDITLDASGVGYRTVPYRDLEKRTVIQYGSSHAVSGSTTNTADLDSLAALVADAVSVQYATTGAQMIIYCQPELSIRCDGAIQQVKHVIDDGTRHAGSFTTASRNVEFDRQIMTRDERQATRNSMSQVLAGRAHAALPRRKDKADD